MSTPQELREQADRLYEEAGKTIEALPREQVPSIREQDEAEANAMAAEAKRIHKQADQLERQAKA